MTDFSGIELFLKVADTGSFVGAGTALGISPSAVGKGIARLEARLGVRLFNRNTRSVRLSREGLSFLDRCRRIVSEMNAAEAEFSSAASTPSGTLKIAMPLAGGFLLPTMCAFMEEHGEIQLDLQFNNRVVDLVEEGFDAAIRVGDLEDSRLLTKRCGSFKLMLVGSPDYLARRGEPRTLADLAGHDSLQFRFDRNGRVFRWPLPPTEGYRDLRLNQRLVTNENLMLLQAALAGMGLAFLPDFIARDHLGTGALRVVLGDELTDEIAWSVVWAPNPYIAPKLKTFLDFIYRRFPTSFGRSFPPQVTQGTLPQEALRTGR